MAHLPIAPGQVYVEVEYGYEYKAKDRLITIKEGECFMLIKKTNLDWWQVKKDEASKPFYVPAQYVREVRKALMPPSNPLVHLSSSNENSLPKGGASHLKKPTNLDLGNHDKPAENIHRHDSKLRLSPSAQSCSSNFSPPVHHKNYGHLPLSPTEQERAHPEMFVHGEGPHSAQKGSSSTLPCTRAYSLESGKPLNVDNFHQYDSGEEERHTNGSESGDELSSSSTELLQTVLPGHGRSESPVYTNLKELKGTQTNLPPLPSGSPLHVIGDWETHKDHSGRHYYYNHSTNERTWKPPRSRETSIGHSREERHSTGDSNEYKHSPPQLSGNVSKTQSLDRKIAEPIVLTKWRHSAYIQEPSEKDAPLSPKPPSPASDSCCSSPKPPASPSEKCGVLNVTKITENGKKVRKNWTSSWTVLQGSVLLFAKGQGGGASWFGGGQSKPEFTVDLRGGSADWASKDKSSKKHVLEVKTRQGTELLIQSDNDGLVSDWLKALQEAINTHPVTSDDSRSDSEEEKPAVEKQDKEKDLTASKKVKTLKPTTSVETSDNKKAKKRLKHFLTRRPTLQAVKDKGYIKDQVFGSSLSSLCQQENTTVPLFVKMCIDHVENSNLSMDGLYRVNGNLAIIQKLRFAVNHDEKVNLADAKWEDIHVTTGALKMFFRELPEPLFTYPLFNDFVSAIKIPDYKQRLQSIRELVRQLPKPNHDTLQALFKHLKKVIEHGEENRMTTQSVAIVFGPTLLRPETETLNVAFNMVYQNQIVEFILLEYENIFGR
ncbi:rho GTPase-activating protein 12b isoform X4 [Nothobranchius furzeri]|uniref:Transcript variant X4 n=1 Tax=Nothobranchius furzeri TaxID=105023 RepID=A0A9D3BTG5_NOTFU|nr:rho GTPase-activating protein 12 isoform X5 [Nothobranchius furzeri]KAF7221947.1 transcript variant X4 [Nothobranchius furzeri]